MIHDNKKYWYQLLYIHLLIAFLAFLKWMVKWGKIFGFYFSPGKVEKPSLKWILHWMTSFWRPLVVVFFSEGNGWMNFKIHHHDVVVCQVKCVIKKTSSLGGFEIWTSFFKLGSWNILTESAFLKAPQNIAKRHFFSHSQSVVLNPRWRFLFFRYHFCGCLFFDVNTIFKWICGLPVKFWMMMTN